MEIKIKIQERKTSEPVQKMVQSGCVLPRHLEMVELTSMALMKTGVETVCQESPARQLLESKVQDKRYKRRSRQNHERILNSWELHTRGWKTRLRSRGSFI
jgi:hypothetical protein